MSLQKKLLIIWQKGGNLHGYTVLLWCSLVYNTCGCLISACGGLLGLECNPCSYQCYVAVITVFVFTVYLIIGNDTMALCTCVVKTLCLFVVLTPIANDSIQQPVTEDGLFTVMLLEILFSRGIIHYAHQTLVVPNYPRRILCSIH